MTAVEQMGEFTDALGDAGLVSDPELTHRLWAMDVAPFREAEFVECLAVMIHDVDWAVESPSDLEAWGNLRDEAHKDAYRREARAMVDMLGGMRLAAWAGEGMPATQIITSTAPSEDELDRAAEQAERATWGTPAAS